MAKVKSNEISMKPKWYFVVGSIVMILGLAASAIGAIFLTNVTLFLFRQHGPNGQYRFQELLTSFPWWVPILAICGIAVGVWMLKKYDFSYKRNFWLISLGFVIAIVLSAFMIDQLGLNDVWFKHGPMRRLYQQGQGQNVNSPSRGPERGKNLDQKSGTYQPTRTLPEGVKKALDEAIQDEYKAYSTYQKIIDTFGMVRPFSMIKEAEEQHIASLIAIYDTYGLSAPKNTWTNEVSVPETLS